MSEPRTDVCVVGGGPAGIAAATTAAERDHATVLIDDGARPGGQIWRGPLPERARAWLERAKRAGVEILTDATVVHAGGPEHLVVFGRRSTIELGCRSLILATGAQERLLPFPGWTLPNVTGVGGLQALAKGGLRMDGRRVVIAGSGPLLLAVAADIRRRGASIVAVVEQAPRARVLGLGARALGSGSRLGQTLGLARDLARVRRLYGAWPVRALGDGRVERVEVREGAKTHTFACDYLACSFGLVPETRLARLLGCALDEDCVRVDEDQRTSLDAVYCAGEPTGIGGVDAALLEGEVAGYAATGARPPAALLRRRDAQRRWTHGLAHTFRLDPALRELATPETIVCRCEDVTRAQLTGFTDSRQAKLHTRCGMGPCQGRVCEPGLAFCFGLGSGRPRPPLAPLPLSRLTPN